MKTELNSKERVLAALEHKSVDHVPICFDGLCHGWVQFVNDLFPDAFARAAHYLELGADTAIRLHVDWQETDQGVDIREWAEWHGDEERLVKEYATPKGSLRQVVRKTAGYPYASLPLFDDHNVPPGRSSKYLIDSEVELDRLECLLGPPGDRAVTALREYATRARAFCHRHGIMLTGYLPGVGDPLMWLSGAENIIFAAMDEPGFLHRYIGIVADWNRMQLEALLDAGVDMVIRRGWYESTDFWSPKLYREFLFGPLKREVHITHQAGAKYAYIMNSGATALADQFGELGVDVLTNIEPEKNDVRRIKREIGARVSLCGGVNNYHIIEAATEGEVERAVGEAIELLGQGGGFILAPSDSILARSATAQRNFYKMIATWKAMA